MDKYQKELRGYERAKKQKDFKKEDWIKGYLSRIKHLKNDLAKYQEEVTVLERILNEIIS